jgi:NADPH-dependent ferric siderophore reductase
MSERVARRVRHELKLRLLEVQRVESVTPKMVRVTLGGEALAGFVSAAYDDHVKVFLPDPGQERPVLPVPGMPPAAGPRPTARDFTPRRFDAAASQLQIDFALHGHGPAASWAAQARAGQFLGVGGPRGSFIVPDNFDWYLLVGDETALPAIGRRLEELGRSTRALVVAEVADAAEQQAWRSDAPMDVIWVHRGAAEPGSALGLQAAVAKLTLPHGDGYSWVAGESAVAKAIRHDLLAERGLKREWVKAAAYWKRGASAVHETYDD